VEEANPPTLTGPERVRNYGLLEALRLLAGDFSHDGIRVDVRTYEYSLIPLAGSGNAVTIEQDIYRIVQEALSNAIKHARPQEILVLLDGSESERLCLSISDDGVGFVPGPRDESRAGGFGMKTMRERAEALGGRLRLISAPGRGTTVEVTIPRVR
jgi:NarL family two-component system sensor histidine kinase LiaS